MPFNFGPEHVTDEIRRDFLAHIPAHRNPHECWVWDGPFVNGTPTQRIRRPGSWSTTSARRVAVYALTLATPPKSEQIRPKCKNGLCVNPQHLYTVSHAAFTIHAEYLMLPATPPKPQYNANASAPSEPPEGAPEHITTRDPAEKKRGFAYSRASAHQRAHWQRMDEIDVPPVIERLGLAQGVVPRLQGTVQILDEEPPAPLAKKGVVDARTHKERLFDFLMSPSLALVTFKTGSCRLEVAGRLYTGDTPEAAVAAAYRAQQEGV